MWICSFHTEGKFHDLRPDSMLTKIWSISHSKITHFCSRFTRRVCGVVYLLAVWRVHTPLFWRVYPSCFWRAVLGKKFTSSIPGCWERNANQSLTVTPVEPRGLVRRSVGGQARHISWQASPWHHLVSPIRFVNGGT